jgi:phage head maturation protease
MKPLKLTEQIAADIKARAKSIDLKAVEKLRKAKEENGTFDVIISTEDIDRAGEFVRQNGWDLANYKNNPIVLWGHDYYSLPIGVCTETYETTVRGVPALGARGVFLSADINPFAQQVRQLYEFGMKAGQGVGCTTSVGFIPKEFDPNSEHPTITKAELLEFSFVPVPANQGVGPAQGRALTIAEARELGIDMAGVKIKGMEFAALRGSIPENASEVKATERAKWVAPKLEDLTKKAWADLTIDEKAEVASYFAYVKDVSMGSFEDLCLPIRRASDGAVVWHGVKAAMDALLAEKSAVEVEGDRKAVYDHLVALYKLFNKKAPEYTIVKESQAGDHCELDDGTPGVLTSDPNDPDGPLVCLPEEQDKGAKAEHSSQKALLKSISDEHDRHTGEIEDALESFKAGVVEPESEEKSEAMTGFLKELHASMQDEQTMHRAKSIASFRGFDPAEDKAFDKAPHLNALRGAHDTYEEKCTKALNDFEEKCMKGEPEAIADHTDSFAGALEGAQKSHKKAVVKIAKAMCRSAFGEEDQADEKTIAILNEYLAPHIDKQILPAIVAKVGAKLSAQTKEQIVAAHSHLKAAQSVLEDLHGGLADGNDEEGRSDEGKTLDDGRRENRSKSRAPSHVDPALRAHVEAREILREVESTIREGLKNFNFEIRGGRK